MNFQLSTKAIQQLSSDKAAGSDAIPGEIYKVVSISKIMADKFTKLFHCVWRKEAIPQEFKDASIIHMYMYNWKEILKSVTTIGPSLYCQLLGRFWQIFCWNAWMDNLIRLVFYQKVSMDSGRTDNRHNLYSKATPREMPRTKCGPQHNLCQPYQGIRYSQSWRALEYYSEVWLASRAHSHGTAVPRWSACTGAEWW